MTTAAATDPAFADFIAQLASMPPDKIRQLLDIVPNPSDDLRAFVEFHSNPKFKQAVSDTVWEIVK